MTKTEFTSRLDEHFKILRLAKESAPKKASNETTAK